MLAIATWVSASSSHQVEQLDSLVVPRTADVATPLSDGRILIAGGRDADGNLVAASETFDPQTQTPSTLSDFLAADGVTATYSRTADETVAGSPYTISATLSPTAVLSNYSITYNTAAFTITPKAASVTPNPASKVYGSADPVFTGTLSGFLAADGVTATYSRTAGETVLGSPYTISATLSPAVVLSNHSIT